MATKQEKEERRRQLIAEAESVIAQFREATTGRPPPKAVNGSYQEAVKYKAIMKRAATRSTRIDVSVSVLERRLQGLKQIVAELRQFQ